MAGLLQEFSRPATPYLKGGRTRPLMRARLPAGRARDLLQGLNLRHQSLDCGGGQLTFIGLHLGRGGRTVLDDLG